MRIFEKNKVTPFGKILPKDKFELFYDEPTKDFDPEKMAKVIATAEKYLDDPIRTIPLWNYRQYMEQGSVQIYGTLYMERLEKLVYLGIAEGYEKKGRFLHKLIDWIWAILEMSSWVLPEHTWHFPHRSATKVPPVVGDKYMHGLELGAIYLGATLALVYSYNKAAIDSVCTIISERIEYELYNRIIRPYLNCDFSWEGDRGNKVNNWCPWNISNILLVTALIEEDVYNREKVVEKALRHIDNFVSWYKEDGGCDEGPVYWGAAGGALFDCLEILYDMSGGQIELFSEPIVKAIGEYIPKFNVCGKRFINFADSAASATHDGELLRRYGEKCGSDILVAFGGVMAAGVNPGVHFRHPYRSVKALLYPIRKSEDIRPRAAKSVYFPDLKVMVERESENPDQGLLLAVKGGTNGESHNHNDVGNFVVYYNGEPVIIDVGVGEYTKKTFSPQRYEIFSMQSRYHNLPMFDNIGQMQGTRYASSNELYDPEKHLFSAELKGAYPQEAGVLSLTRSCSLLCGKVTVEDRVELDKERRIDFCFMTHRKPTLTEKGCIALPQGRTLRYDPSRLDCEIEEFDPEDALLKRSWESESLWRIKLYTITQKNSYSFEII